MLKKKSKANQNINSSKQIQKLVWKAEWNYINNIINAGLKNRSKPLWNYIKAKKQVNIGIAPLIQMLASQTTKEKKADIDNQN